MTDCLQWPSQYSLRMDHIEDTASNSSSIVVWLVSYRAITYQQTTFQSSCHNIFVRWHWYCWWLWSRTGHSQVILQEQLLWPSILLLPDWYWSQPGSILWTLKCTSPFINTYYTGCNVPLYSFRFSKLAVRNELEKMTLLAVSENLFKPNIRRRLLVWILLHQCCNFINSLLCWIQ
jgi:hypothetical protein